MPAAAERLVRAVAGRCVRLPPRSGRSLRGPGVLLALSMLVCACATPRADTGQPPDALPDARAAPERADEETPEMSPADRRAFERDRAAILAMAGDYRVTFDFRETVPFVEGYEPQERFRASGREIVRVIEDRGDLIRLQHILVVGEERRVAVKHWRQDWTYEPDRVLVFIGGNAWTSRPVEETEADGKWAQEVYQVDDSPRYGALAAWSHDRGISQWEPAAEWRPLPRRDATTRSDYHAIDGVNRHAITPFGWTHEQDNVKLVLTTDEPRALVREIGVNTYRRSDDVAADVAERYWAETREYWSGVRAEWARLEAAADTFGLTIQGEPEPLYDRLLELADEIREGETEMGEALRRARSVIDEYTTTEVGALEQRLPGDPGENGYR